MNTIYCGGKNCGSFLSKEPISICNVAHVNFKEATGICKPEPGYSNKVPVQNTYTNQEKQTDNALAGYQFFDGSDAPLPTIRGHALNCKSKEVSYGLSQTTDAVDTNSNNYILDGFRDDFKYSFNQQSSNPNDFEILGNTTLFYSPSTSMIGEMRSDAVAYPIDNNYNSAGDSSNYDQNPSFPFVNQNIVYRNTGTSKRNPRAQISSNFSRNKFRMTSYSYSGGCHLLGSASTTISSSATNSAEISNDEVIHNILKRENNVSNLQQPPDSGNSHINTTDSTLPIYLNSMDTKYSLRCKRKVSLQNGSNDYVMQNEQSKVIKYKKKTQSCKAPITVNPENYSHKKNSYNFKQKQKDNQQNLLNLTHDFFVKKEIQSNEIQSYTSIATEIHSNDANQTMRETRQTQQSLLSPIARSPSHCQATPSSFTMPSHGQIESISFASQANEQSNFNAIQVAKRSSPATRELYSRLAQQMPPVPGVKFQQSDQRWIARWTTSDGKRACRSFSVNIYGFKEARRRAVESRQVGVSRSGRNVNNFFINGGNTSANVTGVRYDRTQSRWVSSYYENGKRKFRYFTVRENGYENAKRLAIHWKNTKDERILKAKSLAVQSGMSDYIMIPFDCHPNTSNDYQPVFTESISTEHYNKNTSNGSNNNELSVGLSTSQMTQHKCGDMTNLNNFVKTKDETIIDNNQTSQGINKITERYEAEHAEEDRRVTTDTTGSQSERSLEKCAGIPTSNEDEDDISDNSLTSTSTIPGVIYDRKNQRWGARWSAIDGRRAGKYFPVSQYGFQKAKLLAIQCRQEARKQHISKKRLKKSLVVDGNENTKSCFDEYSVPVSQLQQDIVHGGSGKGLSSDSSLISTCASHDLTKNSHSTEDFHDEKPKENTNNVKTQLLNASVIKTEVNNQKDSYAERLSSNMTEYTISQPFNIKKEQDACSTAMLINCNCDSSFPMKEEFDYLSYSVPSSYLDGLDYFSSVKENTPPLLTMSSSSQNTTISHLLFRDVDVISSLVDSVIAMGITNADAAVSPSGSWQNPLKCKSNDLYESAFIYPQRYSSCNGMCSLSSSITESDKEKQVFASNNASLCSPSNISSSSQLTAMPSGPITENVLNMHNTVDNSNGNDVLNNFSVADLSNDLGVHCPAGTFSDEQSAINMITDTFLKFPDISGIMETGLVESSQDFSFG